MKFSTNGTYIDDAAAERLAAMDYLDIQVSLDGADARINDLVRGEGSHAAALAAMGRLAKAEFGPFKISIVVTRHNVDQLDQFKSLADSFGAQLRITRLRPSGRGADTWHELHPTQAQQRQLYHWLLDRPDVLTGDSFFHLSALGESLPGLNLCGAGRVVCLIDPVGDVYACPFVIHDEFLAGQRPRRRRVHRGVATFRPVHLPPRAREPGGVHQLRQLRRLPGRVHGVEVLRRARSHRPGPGVREGRGRAAAGGDRRRVAGPSCRARRSTTPARVPLGDRCRWASGPLAAGTG